MGHLYEVIEESMGHSRKMLVDCLQGFEGSVGSFANGSWEVLEKTMGILRGC